MSSEALQDQLRGTLDLTSEVELMPRVAGFPEIRVRGDCTDDPATTDHEKLVLAGIR